VAQKKKKKPNTPRAKRMNRQSRLQSAVSWLEKYKGKNYIRGYSKRFGVDTGNAIVELGMLGVPLSEADIQAKAGAKASVRAKQARKEKRLQRLREPVFDDESDGTFAYIAGYTEGGFAWELHGRKWRESTIRKVSIVQCLPSAKRR